jgi:hypothetical protein
VTSDSGALDFSGTIECVPFMFCFISLSASVCVLFSCLLVIASLVCFDKSYT